MEYRLYPPFLIVPEYHSFDEAWESFCCKLLNLENKVSEIYKRKPPESGIDLYFPSNKIAYQCKSIESGLDSGFNITKAKNSVLSAQKIKTTLGWEQYQLCTNVELTGKQEEALKATYENLIIRPKSYWLLLSEKFPDQVRRNFRQLIQIPAPSIKFQEKKDFKNFYTKSQIEKLKIAKYPIFFYSEKYDSVWELYVSPSFTGRELLKIIQEGFEIPEAFEITGEAISINKEIKVKLSQKLYSNQKEVDLNVSLKANGINSNSILLLQNKLEIVQENIEDVKNKSKIFTAKMNFEKSFIASPKSFAGYFKKKAEVELGELLKKYHKN